MTRIVLALVAALTLAVPAQADSPLLDLRGCHLNLHALTDTVERLQPAFVPERYAPMGWVPGVPFIAVWSARCAGVSVAGRPHREAQLSLLSVAIRHPDRPAGEQPLIELPNTWAMYLHAVFTDRRDIARRLRRIGVPARRVRGMRFERRALAELPAPLRDLPDTRVSVPGRWASWTRPVVQQEPAHTHANSFWRDRADGSTVVLDLRIPIATDHLCYGMSGVSCGGITAETGSPASRFLGGPRPVAAAADHELIPRGVIVASGAGR